MMDSEHEAERLQRVYGDYEAGGRARHWQHNSRGSAYIERERDRAVVSSLGAAGLWPPKGYRILDLGCGRGSLMKRFEEWGASAHEIIGVDLLAERLQDGLRDLPGRRFVLADAASRSLADQSFRLVIAFTLFSSVISDSVAADVAAEMDRVVEPRGAVLWYDIRVPNL